MVEGFEILVHGWTKTSDSVNTVRSGHLVEKVCVKDTLKKTLVGGLLRLVVSESAWS